MVIVVDHSFVELGPAAVGCCMEPSAGDPAAATQSKATLSLPEFPNSDLGSIKKWQGIKKNF